MVNLAEAGLMSGSHPRSPQRKVVVRFEIVTERFEVFEADFGPCLDVNIREGRFDFAKIAAACKNLSSQVAYSVLLFIAVDIGDVLSGVQIAQLNIGADYILLQRGKLASLPKSVVPKLLKLDVGTGHIVYCSSLAKV